jgi:hypothetical protein
MMDKREKGEIMKRHVHLRAVSAALTLILGILSVQCAGFSSGARGTMPGETQVWISDWRQNIFQDTEMPPDGKMSVDLVAARNDIEPFQINVRSSMKGEITGIVFSGLVSGAHTIDSMNCRYNFVDFVRSGTNSRYADNSDPDAVLGDWGIKWVNISNPIRIVPKNNITAFPEILSTEKTKNVKAGVTQPVWIKIRIPGDTVPGIYSGSVEVDTSFGKFKAGITVDVQDIIIPTPESPEAFSLEIWSQLVGNFDTEIDVIEDAYGVKVDSPKWWTVMDAFAKLMKENRLNVLCLNQTDLLLHGKNTAVDKDGNVIFDWSFFNKFVEFFRANAGIQRFLCGPLSKYKANPRNYNNDILFGEETNDYTQTFISCIERGRNGKAEEVLRSVDIEELNYKGEVPGIPYIRQYAAALYRNLTENGWLDIWGHRIIDEPGKRQLAAVYPHLEKALSDNCPGIITGDAFTVWTAEEQSGHTELYAVIENSYEELPEHLDAVLNDTDIFWLYTSSVPIKDNYLNRAIDQPVWFMEMLGYLCFKRGAAGYLHWGLNQWNTWTKDYMPFPDYPADEMTDNVLGDASCVYPDRKNLGVRSSIRVEALREASELNSILNLAKSADPERTGEIVDMLIRKGNDYETDIEKISEARKTLFYLASKGILSKQAG